MAVAQVGPQHIKQHIHRIGATQRYDVDLSDQRKQHHALHDPDDDCDQQVADDRFNRMGSVNRQRGQHIGRMMHRMERPKHLPFMVQPVRPVFAEIRGDNDDQCRQQAARPTCGRGQKAIGGRAGKP
ncbi:hypothetical protein SuNHUV7_10500 (plasmid) [Pseudoseohaeicola sp. NH-UV-7]